MAATAPMRLILIFVLLQMTSPGLFARDILLNGVLRDQETRAAIPFATVGISELGIGTITDVDGTFELALDSAHIHEDLLFSALGYEPVSHKIQDLLGSGQDQFFLQEAILELDGVVVADEKIGYSRLKQVQLGNPHFNTGTMRLDAKANGGAMALLVESENAPFRLNRAKLRIRSSSLPNFKVRIRILDVDANGLPGQDLVNQSIVVSSDIEKGWLWFDLNEESIWVYEHSFFVAFEWVMDRSDKEQILQGVKEHLQEDPKRLNQNTHRIGERRINEKTIEDFYTGVWFGTLIHPVLGKNQKTYYRLNNLDSWKPSAAVLSATIFAAEVVVRDQQLAID